MSGEIFKSGTDSEGKFAGVFEYDGETAYFYLYHFSKQTDMPICRHLHILTGETDICDADVRVVLSKAENFIGLCVRDRLWAVFDIEGSKYGGNYDVRRQPNIPDEIVSEFF